MPILGKATTVVDPVLPDRKLHNDADLKTSVLFNKDNDLVSIIRYVDGNKWTVAYFQQIREINTEPRQPDINIPPSELSYNRINSLDIYLDGGIEQNDANDITGTATINAGFMPSIGDPFIATLSGGREAIFTITSYSKKIYSLHDTYIVEFKLYMFLDRNGEFYRDLLLKTMKEYHYDKDHILDKGTPIILSSDYKNKLDLKQTRLNLIKYYFNRFYDTEKSVIKLPTVVSVSSTYLDTLLIDFIYKTIGYTDYPHACKLTRYDIGYITDNSIYDLLLNRDIDNLPFVNKALGYKLADYTASMPVARHIRWLGVNYIVDNVTQDNEVTMDDKVLENTVTGIYTPPLGDEKGGYIFSSYFYNNDVDNCGIVEKILLQYLRKEAVDVDMLNTVVSEYRYWNNVEQFYLIPIVVLVMQDMLNNTYSPL